MRIAVIFEGNLSSGGGFQQALNMILLFKDKQNQDREFIFFTTNPTNLEDLRMHNVEAHCFTISRLDRWVIKGRRHIGINLICQKLGLQNAFDRTFDQHNIDLLYFVSATGMALYTEKYNYIYTVWDLCHRDHPEFPEVRNHREFEAREEVLHKALPRAVVVLADSKLGKENLIRRYQLDSERVKVLPFFPSPSTLVSDKQYEETKVDITQKYGVKYPYLFYPAQFWPHKNHIYILRAMHHLNKNSELKVSAVFSGSSGRSYEHIQTKIKEYGLEDQVHTIGFVSGHELPSLYKQSLALVMPTWFGPTNLPPLEAFRLSVPVLYPDLPGLREQVGDAALLMDLKNPCSLADQICSLLENTSLQESLKSKGQLRFHELVKIPRWGVLAEVFDDFDTKLSCWK